MKGKVYLVGAGPGDRDLLTVKAQRLLRNARAVLHDDLISPAILDLVPSNALVYNVGKRCGHKKVQQEEIHFLMIGLAETGIDVIRLKSGDPLIFGRAGEEMEALRSAAVEYEVVPGVTSALGAASAAGIPLTHRDASSAVIFLAAQKAPGKEADDWSRLVSSGATTVLYMPGNEYEQISARLQSAGLAATTPCAIVSRATTPEEKVHRSTLAELGDAPALPSPTLLIVGKVVGLADAHRTLAALSPHPEASLLAQASSAIQLPQPHRTADPETTV